MTASTAIRPNQPSVPISMAVREDHGAAHATRLAGISAVSLRISSSILTRQLDDHFGMLAVLEQRIFDGLGAVDEQAAIEAVLLLGDPLAAVVTADEDDGGRCTTRGRGGKCSDELSSSRSSPSVRTRQSQSRVQCLSWRI